MPSRYFMLILIAFGVDGLAIPKYPLSDEKHYRENDEHNVEYDHEAFLGEDDSKTFDELTPEESKERLGKIVDKIDVDKNGFVTVQELRDWIQFSQRRYIVEDAARQWKAMNHDEDPTVSWDTYKRMTYGYIDGDLDSETFQYKNMMERDLRRWKKADVDGTGDLNQKEFIDFVHPEEAEHMKDIVVMETMEDIDKNKDGKIGIEEYIGDMYGDSDMDEEPDWLENERKQFSQYRDKNKDGYLDMEEVKTWILPDDYDNSEAEAKHLVYETDVNRDSHLSKTEILDKYDLFVGSQVTDFGEALVRHDEF